MIEAGSEAPDFTLTDQNGDEVTLSSLRGSPVVLYFYPRAETSGCTTQACGVRDSSQAYARYGARVLGVSPDSVEEISSFAGKHALDFTLLSDPDHSVAEAYGAWGERSMYGKKFMGIIRSTWVIDADGIVTAVLPNVKPAEHDEKVLAALQELSRA